MSLNMNDAVVNMAAVIPVKSHHYQALQACL